MVSPPWRRRTTSSGKGSMRRMRRTSRTANPGILPEWAEADPRQYWAAADEHERANGRLFVQVEFALPRELDDRQQREVASSFAADLTGGERLPYTLAIHRGGVNPHAHLMISERRPGRPRPGCGDVVQAGQHQGPGEGRGQRRPAHCRAGNGWKKPGSGGRIGPMRRLSGPDSRSGSPKRR